MDKKLDTTDSGKRKCDDDAASSSSSSGGKAEAGGSGTEPQRPTTQAGSEHFQMNVPNTKVGLVVGKGGEMITSIQDMSGARIQLIPLHPPLDDTSVERTVHIDGTPEQVEIAKQLVNEVISEMDKKPGGERKSDDAAASSSDGKKEKLRSAFEPDLAKTVSYLLLSRMALRQRLGSFELGQFRDEMLLLLDGLIEEEEDKVIECSVSSSILDAVHSILEDAEKFVNNTSLKDADNVRHFFTGFSALLIIGRLFTITREHKANSLARKCTRRTKQLVKVKEMVRQYLKEEISGIELSKRVTDLSCLIYSLGFP